MASKNKSEKYNWTSANTRKLIEFLKEYEHIYNPKHNDYKKSGLREKVFQEFADSVGCSVSDAKSRWEGLRTYFQRECAKVSQSKTSGAGTDDVYTPKWEFFSEMLFIKSSNQPRKGRTTLDLDVPEVIVKESETPSMCSSGAIFHADEIIEPSEDETNSTVNELNDERQSASCASTSSGCTNSVNKDNEKQKTLRRKRKVDDGPLHNEFMEEALKCLKSSPPKVENDEHDIFAAFLATQMRILNPKDADVLKLEIMKLVFEKKHESFMLDK